MKNYLNSRINILLTFLLYSTNTYAININFFRLLTKKQDSPTKIFFQNIKNATTTLFNDTLDKSKNIIYTLIGPRKKDIIDNALKISAITTLIVISGYIIKKIAINKKLKQIELDKNNTEINKIIENFNFNAPGQQECKISSTSFNNNLNNNIFESQALENSRSLIGSNDKKKWALWPNDMPFLTLLQIPQDVLRPRLIQDIKNFYKINIQENTNETNYLVELFTKDLETEIADYQKKYNIILISNNFDKKQECLDKIKDNLKKLIYLKSTITSWAAQL